MQTAVLDPKEAKIATIQKDHQIQEACTHDEKAD